MKQIKTCKDCGATLLSNRNVYCDCCRPAHIPHCMDCGKVLHAPKALRCKSCNVKHQWSCPNSKIHTAVAEMNAKQWADPEYHQYMAELTRVRMIKLYEDPEVKKAWCTKMTKHNADPAYRASVSVKSKNRWANPDNTMHWTLRHFIPSPLEVKFRCMLDEASVKYIQQCRPYGCYKVYDFYLPDYDALVEIDGIFWHYSDWAMKNGLATQNDVKDRWAREHGFIMVRIPENDLSADIVPNWLLPELEKLTEIK